MDTQQPLSAIHQELLQVKSLLLSISPSSKVSDKWVPRSEVMHFFNYAPTQMAALENSGELVVAKIGKRKFLLRESIERLLEKNILNVNEGNKAGN